MLWFILEDTHIGLCNACLNRADQPAPGRRAAARARGDAACTDCVRTVRAGRLGGDAQGDTCIYTRVFYRSTYTYILQSHHTTSLLISFTNFADTAAPCRRVLQGRPHSPRLVLVPGGRRPSLPRRHGPAQGAGRSLASAVCLAWACVVCFV